MTAAAVAFASSAAVIVQPVPRTYRGNMCGVRVPGLHNVAGGSDPALVISWFYDRYPEDEQAKIRAAWKGRYPDVLLSWADSRVAGFGPYDFVSTCRELVAHGFLPTVMACSRYYDPSDVGEIIRRVQPVLIALLNARVIARFCVGWELSLWLSPAQVQELIDAFAPFCKAFNVPMYVHFQQGYFAYEVDGPHATTADFWNQQVGKLTGVLHQRTLTWDEPMYQARIVDCLERFAGGYGFVTDCGRGHPFDFIALEITAMPQFEGTMSEADGDRWGRVALSVPPVHDVAVMGSGNGA